MRGAPLRDSQRPLILGIIPADAGSTSYIEMTLQNGRDHPRGCGEHADWPRLPPAPGIIPADAGSTWFKNRIWLWPRDHPRGCGEHDDLACMDTPPHGSSPRMRGAPKQTQRPTRKPRIIPADAGSTQGSALFAAGSQDHPRGCGEHTVMWSMSRPTVGSSPRMRGAPSISTRTKQKLRIIPADAGSTTRKITNGIRVQDHPRGCGEHHRHRPDQFRLLGSSPRMRGAHHVVGLWRCFYGIIPADAGSTR